jgi:hypothetical protein
VLDAAFTPLLHLLYTSSFSPSLLPSICHRCPSNAAAAAAAATLTPGPSGQGARQHPAPHPDSSTSTPRCCCWLLPPAPLLPSVPLLLLLLLVSPPRCRIQLQQQHKAHRFTGEHHERQGIQQPVHFTWGVRCSSKLLPMPPCSTASAAAAGSCWPQHTSCCSNYCCC